MNEQNPFNFSSNDFLISLCTSVLESVKLLGFSYNVFLLLWLQPNLVLQPTKFSSVALEHVGTSSVLEKSPGGSQILKQSSQEGRMASIF